MKVKKLKKKNNDIDNVVNKRMLSNSTIVSSQNKDSNFFRQQNSDLGVRQSSKYKFNTYKTIEVP